MKIAVLVKQVPGSESPLPINSDQKWVDESAVSYIMNENRIEDFNNPSQKYRKRILSGARMIDLPLRYISKRILKIY